VVEHVGLIFGTFVKQHFWFQLL